MKHAEHRPFAYPEKAARSIVEIASTVEPVQDGRIHVEKINGPFLFKDKGSPASPSSAAGSSCTRAAPSCGSHRLVRSCSLELGARKRPPAEAAYYAISPRSGWWLVRCRRGSSPACSFNCAAASTSPAATAGSEVLFAILSSAAAASRAW